MRWRRADLRRRVNGNLELRFGRDGLTSYGGLELVRRYFASSGLVALLRRELGATLSRSDFGSVRMMLVILALIMSGGRRVRHLLSCLQQAGVIVQRNGYATLDVGRSPPSRSASDDSIRCSKLRESLSHRG